MIYSKPSCCRSTSEPFLTALSQKCLRLEQGSLRSNKLHLHVLDCHWRYCVSVLGQRHRGLVQATSWSRYHHTSEESTCCHEPNFSQSECQLYQESVLYRSQRFPQDTEMPGPELVACGGLRNLDVFNCPEV